MIFNVPDVLDFEIRDDNVRFHIDGLSTNWMSVNDKFIRRISMDNLNKVFVKKHLIKEITVKNTLDEGLKLLENAKFAKAIECFDKIIYYDLKYGEALIGKSRALYAQRHFVKSLRYYKKSVKADPVLNDNEYYKLLLKNSNEERSNFPKIKLNIYTGDEFFIKGEYARAVESYNRALVNPSKFREKILTKLLDKKGTALFKLEKYDEALECFKKSDSDYSFFKQGLCEYELGLPVNDDFKRLLDVEMIHQYKQVLILNKLGFFEESLSICYYLLDNHFKVDELYLNCLLLTIDCLNQLNESDKKYREIYFQLTC